MISFVFTAIIKITLNGYFISVVRKWATQYDDNFSKGTFNDQDLKNSLHLYKLRN